jgi:hypothetical protein
MIDMDRDEVGIGPQKGEVHRKKTQPSIVAEVDFADNRFVYLKIKGERVSLPVDLDSFPEQWERIKE